MMLAKLEPPQGGDFDVMMMRLQYLSDPDGASAQMLKAFPLLFQQFLSLLLKDKTGS